MNEGLKIHGAMQAVLKKADGTVEVTQKDNLIVNGGFDAICANIAGTSVGAFKYIGVGTGNTAAAATQTALVSELPGRGTGTYAHTAGTKVFTVSYLFAAGVATGAITEAGVFNASSAGTMLDRVVFNVINKDVNDTLTITFTFTLS